MRLSRRMASFFGNRRSSPILFLFCGRGAWGIDLPFFFDMDPAGNPQKTFYMHYYMLLLFRFCLQKLVTNFTLFIRVVKGIAVKAGLHACPFVSFCCASIVSTEVSIACIALLPHRAEVAFVLF